MLDSSGRKMPSHSILTLRVIGDVWNPETKPDLFSVTQNIELRPVNVINHAALYELTS